MTRVLVSMGATALVWAMTEGELARRDERAGEGLLEGCSQAQHLLSPLLGFRCAAEHDRTVVAGSAMSCYGSSAGNEIVRLWIWIDQDSSEAGMRGPQRDESCEAG